jgi:plasmid stabilization system protein ParE
MPKKIIWSPLAEKDFTDILDYLKNSWTETVLIKFIDITEELILQISINNRQYPIINKKYKIRKCVITKHNSLYYRDSKNQIEILRIFDT